MHILHVLRLHVIFCAALSGRASCACTETAPAVILAVAAPISKPFLNVVLSPCVCSIIVSTPTPKHHELNAEVGLPPIGRSRTRF